jgi:hypothetical protein
MLRGEFAEHVDLTVPPVAKKSPEDEYLRGDFNSGADLCSLPLNFPLKWRKHFIVYIYKLKSTKIKKVYFFALNSETLISFLQLPFLQKKSLFLIDLKVVGEREDL